MDHPLDNLFLSIGNELIDILGGFTNDTNKDSVISKLRASMQHTIELIKQHGSIEAQEKGRKEY